MSQYKNFLIGYAVVYLVAAISLNVVLGPPGLSGAYLDEYKADHDRYLDITKDDAYKLWAEKPSLNTPEEAFASEIEFVTEYRNRAAFILEDTRRGRYDLAFALFNVTMVLVLVTRFGRKPMLNLIKSMIQDVRDRIGDAEKQRQVGEKRKNEALSKVDGLPDEHSKHEAATDRRIAREAEKVKESTAHGLAMLERETADRKHHEELLAEGEMKRALVDQALKVVAERYEANRSPETESALLDKFAAQLGDRKS